MKNILIGLIVITMNGCLVEMKTENYDKSCQEDIDCILVYEGTVCQEFTGWENQCRCPSVAINSEEVEQYYEELNSLSCVNFIPFEAIDECFCVNETVPICVNNKCSEKTNSANNENIGSQNTEPSANCRTIYSTCEDFGDYYINEVINIVDDFNNCEEREDCEKYNYNISCKINDMNIRPTSTVINSSQIHDFEERLNYIQDWICTCQTHVSCSISYGFERDYDCIENKCTSVEYS